MNSIANKKLVIFDLDGTLAESKSIIDDEMSALLNQLLETHFVAIISGGSYAQFTKQFLLGLQVKNKTLEKLHLFPTCGAQYYCNQNGLWINQYTNSLSIEEKRKIYSALEQALATTDYKQPEKIYGEIIEDRDSQITFSAVGQLAPVREKNEWNKKYNNVRFEIIEKLQKLLPEFDSRIGGTTSIDITHKNINKHYGMRKIEEILKIPIEEMLFVGDALFPGGNDEPVKRTGVDTLNVKNSEETKRYLSLWLNSQN